MEKAAEIQARALNAGNISSTASGNRVGNRCGLS